MNLKSLLAIAIAGALPLWAAFPEKLSPSSAAFDKAGNIFFVDEGGHAIYKVTVATGTTTLVAGVPGQPGHADGPAGKARFNTPQGIAVDAEGGIYVSDSGNAVIRKVLPGGAAVVTFCGIPGRSGLSVDGPRNQASFNSPAGIALDSTGNLFVADNGAHVIRKISPTGIASTIAGIKYSKPGSTDGPGPIAKFNGPWGIAVDRNSNIFVADSLNHTIRKITPDGVVSTFAGVTGKMGGGDGPAATANFYLPSGLAFDTANNLYVVDHFNNQIRKISADGMVSTFAGDAQQRPGRSDGKLVAAQFRFPTGIATGPDGTLVVADQKNGRLRLIKDGQVTTIGSDERSSQYGTARFNQPMGLSFDGIGNLYVADARNSVIRKIDPTRKVTTLAGQFLTQGSADGPGNWASFNLPFAVAADKVGELVVADTFNGTLRRIGPDGMVSTVAGGGRPGPNSTIADGKADRACFSRPRSLALDRTGIVYVADGAYVRKVSPDGEVSTFAGHPLFVWSSSTADGVGTKAGFSGIGGIAIDDGGNLFLTDSDNHTIREITPDGTVSTFAGKSGKKGMGITDGPLSEALFTEPTGVAVDNTGTIFVSDSASHTIRKISGGTVSTLAGSGVAGHADGGGNAAKFNAPAGLALDASGNLYVADTMNHAIRKIAPDGTVTTYAGKPGESGQADGTASK